MKIVFLIRSLERGGAERQLSLIASGLKQKGHQIYVVTFYKNANNSTNLNYQTLVAAGVFVLSVDKKNRYELLSFLFRLIKIINKIKPEFIYSFLALANILAVIYKIFNKSVVLVWSKRSSDLELKKYHWSLRMEYKIEKFLSAIPDLIIANSQHGKEHLIIHNYRTKICVIHNGVLSDTIKENNTVNNHHWNLMEKFSKKYQLVIGAVGRLDYAKDYETLLNSLKIITKIYINVGLVIVGRVNNIQYQQKLLNLINFLNLNDKVLFLPEMNNISLFYDNINIFVSSSYTEGFSNVIAEAMLHHCPCVVTNAGDSAYLIGKTGIVVERRDYQALASSLIALIEDKQMRIKFGQLSHDRVTKFFNVEQLVINTENALYCLK